MISVADAQKQQQRKLLARVEAGVEGRRIRPGLSVSDLPRDFNLARPFSDIRVGVPDFGQVGKQLSRALRIRQSSLVTFFSKKKVTAARVVRQELHSCSEGKHRRISVSSNGELLRV